jgi:hypothetical protein
VDTGSAGAKAGVATVALASDGAGSSGFAAFALASQQVAVSGNVYRFAVPVVDTTPITLVARVGDAAPVASIAVTNNAPDLFTERLNASLALTSAAFSRPQAASAASAQCQQQRPEREPGHHHRRQLWRRWHGAGAGGPGVQRCWHHAGA